MKSVCAACNALVAFYTTVAGYDYTRCAGCGLIQIDSDTMSQIDNGVPLVKYQDGYWANEVWASRERAFGPGLARAAESLLLCQRDVECFLDIGAGPGFLLDAIAEQVPETATRCFAIETYPPPSGFRTTHANYRVGQISDLKSDSVDAGLCMEVFEHLTPTMLGGLLRELSRIARDDACFLVNTGLAEFTMNENPDYLDPLGRGHITSWTICAVNHLACPYGLIATEIPGRTWAFLLEKAAHSRPVTGRQARPKNKDLFVRKGNSTSALLSLAETSLRESLLRGEFIERTQWALQLKAELDKAYCRPN